MIEKIYKQSGYNDKFPEKIVIWERGSKIPEWLSDISKILSIDPNGEPGLDTRDVVTGGIEIIDSSGSGIVVKTVSESDIVCKDIKTNNIFSLTEEQFDLLFEEDE